MTGHKNTYFVSKVAIKTQWVHMWHSIIMMGPWWCLPFSMARVLLSNWYHIPHLPSNGLERSLILRRWSCDNLNWYQHDLQSSLWCSWWCFYSFKFCLERGITCQNSLATGVRRPLTGLVYSGNRLEMIAILNEVKHMQRLYK